MEQDFETDPEVVNDRRLYLIDLSPTVAILVDVSIAFFALHLINLNIIINGLYYFRIRYISCCFPIYQAFHYVVYCKFALKPVCTDRCCSCGTAVKQVVYWGLFGFLLFISMEYNHWFGSAFTTFPIYCFGVCAFNIAFFLMRIPIFILYALLTCCCNKGPQYIPEHYNYKKHFLYFDYIKETELDRERFGVDDANFRNPV
jgi:hypothetical protein